MRALLALSVVLAASTASQAGNNTSRQRDCELLPGDYGKPVVVAPMPGSDMDPWLLDDPDIIIDDDGPSDDDEGVIYTGAYVWQIPVKKHASRDR
jgi:hypothetical protein